MNKSTQTSTNLQQTQPKSQIQPHRRVLNLTSIKRAAFSTATLILVNLMPSEPALAACNATINGRPMTSQECNVIIQVYGQVLPGHYLVDANGNWVNVNNRNHYGNIYRDAQNNSQGSSGGGKHFNTLIDPTGGCEGGSCVNIIDRY